MTGIVSTASESLFTHDQSDSFYTYYQPSYTPLFEVAFTNSTLETLAQNECQGNDLCLFDVAATGDIKIGVATLKEIDRVDSVIEISGPSKYNYN